MAYPKHHSQDDISDIYLLPHHTHGVFVNIALQVGAGGGWGSAGGRASKTGVERNARAGPFLQG